MTRPDYPAAPRSDTVEVLGGHEVPDPFRPLEDADSEATRAWSAAQAEIFATSARGQRARAAFRDRIAGLTATGTVGPPVWRGDRHFLRRRLPDQEHAVLLTVDPDGTERVLIDPMALDPSGTTTLDDWRPSLEGDLLAYRVSRGGTEESELFVLDVATGRVVDGPVSRTRESPLAWLPGGHALYVQRNLAPEHVPEDERQYHRRVYLHRLGTDPDADDVEVFGADQDKTAFFQVTVSADGRYLVVGASEGTAPRNDVWLADLTVSGPEAPVFRPVQTGVDARSRVLPGRDGRLYILTDLDAPRGRLCVADPGADDLGPDAWTTLVPSDPEAVLEDYAILDGPGLGDAPVLLAAWTRHAVGELTRHDLRTGARTGRVTPGGGATAAPGSIGVLLERPEGGHEAWFGWSDHRTPSAVHRFDARTGEVSVWAAAPGAVALPDVHVRLEEFASKDGTTVRVFVIAPTPEPDVPRPTVLYGYGGFAIPMAPGYAPGVLTWVEAGGVYAIACLRGGSEEGEAWHRAGMREHKQNVFDDFHAAAEHLVARGWTAPGGLGISGGSNGGLLVGAALTQRPELYAAVVCSAPLLDMVRYERFGLGRLWTDEYGTVEVPEELGWLLGYSPYHHVQPGVEYPAVLFTVFDGDSRVDPLHARKMCAALQEAQAGDRPVLLRAESDVGHAERSVSRSVDLSADTLSFLARWTGLTAGA
ncbi:prolyl oligopeptidase family serine peptidase [Yinghuangia sp. ASG 101]|uniref:prolyl oligopeptidase family serine peptidase n=1 Tax=Yinghuangia sp. ASG 101 TaxID=2896848 RepID=UPI001E63E790|nr:prolyl oligopeptidase family serine peptidase [Yinghuangia sp. ASG 101]UGQ09752.1 prolyl oligopeptidase family serine peptidase [Yinghuangia sp. ASG 101]